MNLHAAMRQLVEGVVHRPFATQEIYNRAPYLASSRQRRAKAIEVMGQLGKLGDETFPARILEYVGLRSAEEGGDQRPASRVPGGARGRQRAQGGLRFQILLTHPAANEDKDRVELTLYLRLAPWIVSPRLRRPAPEP